jgi:hypothetical protein
MDLLATGCQNGDGVKLPNVGPQSSGRAFAPSVLPLASELKDVLSIPRLVRSSTKIRPFLHHGPATLERVIPAIGLLGLVPDGMGEGMLG